MSSVKSRYFFGLNAIEVFWRMMYYVFSVWIARLPDNEPSFFDRIGGLGNFACWLRSKDWKVGINDIVMNMINWLTTVASGYAKVTNNIELSIYIPYKTMGVIS